MTLDHLIWGPGRIAPDGTKCDILGVVDRPHYEIGDAKFLDPAWPHPRQIRPIVAEDMIEGVVYEPAMVMLVVKLAPRNFIRAIVRLPPHRRQNTPAAADRAWQRHLDRDPRMKAALPALIQLFRENARRSAS